MADYIALDHKKIKRLKREAQQFQDDIVCAAGTDFMLNIAEAENKMIFDILNGLENETSANVIEVQALVDFLRKAAKNAKQEMERSWPRSNRYYQFWGAKFAMQYLIKHIKKTDWKHKGETNERKEEDL